MILNNIYKALKMNKHSIINNSKYKTPEWFRTSKSYIQKNKNYNSKYNCLYDFFFQESNHSTYTSNYPDNKNKTIIIEITNSSSMRVNMNINFFEKMNLNYKRIIRELILSWALLAKYGALDNKYFDLTGNTNNTIFSHSINRDIDFESLEHINELKFKENSLYLRFLPISSFNLGNLDFLCIEVLVKGIIGLDKDYNNIKKIIIY
uniref:Uncharacterized protein n=1 Tax=Amorphochlora amoebiformis TaxID=1561963 RepID=A0A0H5BLY5_9EUKA|nr:hypothetical protein [Amorphochlora amoebiformis]